MKSGGWGWGGCVVTLGPWVTDENKKLGLELLFNFNIQFQAGICKLTELKHEKLHIFHQKSTKKPASSTKSRQKHEELLEITAAYLKNWASLTNIRKNYAWQRFFWDSAHNFLLFWS